jgi:hypothetical protein
LLIGFTAAFLLPEAVMNQYGVHLATGIGAGSGGWAMKTAEEMNKEEEGDVESEAYPEKES